MAFINNKNSNKLFIDPGNAPVHVQSEGEKLIKTLAAKQINTNTSINELLQQPNRFETPTELLPITACTSGETTLEQFKQHSTHLDQIELLKSTGLSTDEIQLYLTQNLTNVYQDVLKTQLAQIEDKIKRHQTVPIKTISRHDQDLLSVKPDSNETKLHRFVLESSATKRKDNTPSDHPINHLNELERNLFGHLGRQTVPSLAKRRKKMKKVEGFEQEMMKYNTPVQGSRQSLWDMKEVPLTPTKLCQNFLNTTSNNNEQKKVYTCKPQQLYTISQGKIIKLGDNQTQTTHYQQLTEYEIKMIPKFGNYEKGTPSKVRIKTVSNHATVKAWIISCT